MPETKYGWIPPVHRALLPTLAAALLLALLRLFLIRLSGKGFFGTGLLPWLMIPPVTLVALLVWGWPGPALAATLTAVLTAVAIRFLPLTETGLLLIPFLTDDTFFFASGGWLACYRYGLERTPVGRRTVQGSLLLKFLMLPLTLAVVRIMTKSSTADLVVPAVAGFVLVTLYAALTLALLRTAISARAAAGRPPLTLSLLFSKGRNTPIRRLKESFSYKGAVTELYMRIKLALEDRYQVTGTLIPREGTILDIGCGYGFMARMLKNLSPGRQITGIDWDDEKIRVARGASLFGEGLRFERADAQDWECGETFDTVMIFDMLHYLPAEAQERLILKSIGRLSPGGRLVIREGDPAFTVRHNRNRFAEFLSTRVLRFNKHPATGLVFQPREFYALTAARGGFRIERIIEDAARTSNIYLVMVKQDIMEG